MKGSSIAKGQSWHLSEHFTAHNLCLEVNDEDM